MVLTKKQTSNSCIRRLKAEGIDAVIDICRKSFPGGIRGQYPRFIATKWWRDAIASVASETWVCFVEGEVTGYVILVMDNSMYSREKRKRRSGIFLRACTAITCPRLLLRRFFKKMVTYGWSSANHMTNSQNHPIQNKCIWIEPIAVAPHMRGRGIARKMLEHCEKRALDLKRGVVWVKVQPQNGPAIKLYEKSEFVLFSRTSATCTYAKVLDHH